MRYHVRLPKAAGDDRKWPAICILHGSNMVFQLLLAETRDAVPVVRDYMVDAERAAVG